MPINGRQLCKIKAVNWWVINVPLPSEEIQRLIKLLYAQHVNDVELLGQSPLIDIVPNKRQVLLVYLCPDSILRTSDIPQYQLDKFIELAMARIDSKMALPPPNIVYCLIASILFFYFSKLFFECIHITSTKSKFKS